MSKLSIYKIIGYYNKERGSAIKYLKRGGRLCFYLDSEQELELLRPMNTSWKF